MKHKRSKMLLVGVLLLLLSTTLFAVEPEVLWEKTYGGSDYDFGSGAIVTSEGNFLLCGGTNSFGVGPSGFLGRDGYLVKIDSAGGIMWTQTYGGYDTLDQITNCIEAGDGGYVAIGLRLSKSDRFYRDIYVIKLDEDGALIWERTYTGGLYGGWGYKTCVAVDAGYVVTGSILPYSTNVDHSIAFLLKVDENGDSVWQQNYEYALGYYTTSNWMTATSDGGYLFAGGANHPDSATSRDALVTKTDAVGNIVWSKLFGGDESDEGWSVTRTADGGYAVLGTTSSFDVGADDFYLLKLDNDGGIQWERTYGTPESAEWGSGICQTSDGGYIMTGRIYPSCGECPDVYVVRTDHAGDTTWTKTIGGVYYDFSFTVSEIAPGEYIIGGSTESFGYGNLDLYLVRLSEDVSSVDETYETTEQITLISPIGPEIVLQYQNMPHGFHARVFDPSGRLVDELHSSQTQGTISWPVTPVGFSPGVYFIKSLTGNAQTIKVILTR